MTLKSILAVAGLGLALSVPASLQAVGCVTCNVSQSCQRGGDGTHCIIFEFQGQLWCNWEAGCSATMNPLQVSPAGTYLGGETVRLAGRGVDVVPCNGFIVAHDPAANAAGGVHEISI